jgi:hypothetical protein
MRMTRFIPVETVGFTVLLDLFGKRCLAGEGRSNTALCKIKIDAAVLAAGRGKNEKQGIIR